MKKYGNDILKFIGGQTHAICNIHDHPLIPVPDRLANCVYCDRKEHFRCPELGCSICLCKRCFDALEEDVVNRIQIGTTPSSPLLSPHRVNDNDNISDETSYYSNDSNEGSDSDSDNNSDIGPVSVHMIVIGGKVEVIISKLVTVGVCPSFVQFPCWWC